MTVEKIKNKIRDIQKEYFIVNLGIIALGIFLIAFPIESMDFVCRFLGAAMFALGGFRIWEYIKNRKNSPTVVFALIQGCLLIGFGLFFIIRPEILARFIIVVCSLILLMGAVVKLRIGIKYDSYNPVIRSLQTIGALLMIIAGVIAFANPFGAARMLLVFLGISLLVDGLWDLIVMLLIRFTIKDIKSEVKKAEEQTENTSTPKIIDAEFEDHTNE